MIVKLGGHMANKTKQSKGMLVRITPQCSGKLQEKLKKQREITGIFKSTAAYVNELIAADLASNSQN